MQNDQKDAVDRVAPLNEDSHPLTLIVADKRISPCDHATFERFKLWVAQTLTPGEIDTYQADDVTISHWDHAAGDRFPHLLNPCECGTYLPMDVEPGPMLSSAIGLLSDLGQLRKYEEKMEPEFCKLMNALMKMAELSLETNTALEIR